jgi:hypothetical protein
MNTERRATTQQKSVKFEPPAPPTPNIRFDNRLGDLSLSTINNKFDSPEGSVQGTPPPIVTMHLGEIEEAGSLSPFIEELKQRASKKKDGDMNLVIFMLDPQNEEAINHLCTSKITDIPRTHLVVLFTKDYSTQKLTADKQRSLKESLGNCLTTTTQYGLAKVLSTLISASPQPIIIVESPVDE